MMRDTEWLTIDEAAARLKITKRALYTRIHLRDAPPHARVGKRLIFDAAGLDRWMEQRIAAQAPERADR